MSPSPVLVRRMIPIAIRLDEPLWPAPQGISAPTSPPITAPPPTAPPPTGPPPTVPPPTAPTAPPPEAPHLSLRAAPRQSRYVAFEGAPAKEAPTATTVLQHLPCQTEGLLFDGRSTEASLMAARHVAFRARNKAVVAERAYPPTTRFDAEAELRLTRWDSAAASLPAAGTLPWPQTSIVEVFFEYLGSAGASAWYPNFAHNQLFVAWNSSLLAQDELQVLEFPVLAALVGSLPAEHRRTVVGSVPTPILIQRVPRRCSIDTWTPPTIYGNMFCADAPEAVLHRTTVLRPPRHANIYAFEAPPGGRGRYSHAQVVGILRSAYAAFQAITRTDPAPIELHVGYWGCGAYGGNHELMVLLQILAARLACISTVVVHAAPDARPARSAVATVQDIPLHASVEDAVSWIVARGYEWGCSDGN